MSSSVRDITESTEAEGRDDTHHGRLSQAQPSHIRRPRPSVPSGLQTRSRHESSSGREDLPASVRPRLK